MCRLNIKNISYMVLLFLSCFSGCRKRIDLHFVENEVTESKIIGIWVATDESLAEITKEGYHIFNRREDHMLNFLDDGRCIIRTFQAMPSFPRHNEEDQLYIQEKEGTWFIDEGTLYINHMKQQVPVVTIKIRDERVLSGVTHINERTLTIFVGKDKSGLILWQYVGDPDYDEHFVFKKTS